MFSKLCSPNQLLGGRHTPSFFALLLFLYFCAVKIFICSPDRRLSFSSRTHSSRCSIYLSSFRSRPWPFCTSSQPANKHIVIHARGRCEYRTFVRGRGVKFVQNWTGACFNFIAAHYIGRPGGGGRNERPHPIAHHSHGNSSSRFTKVCQCVAVLLNTNLLELLRGAAVPLHALQVQTSRVVRLLRLKTNTVSSHIFGNGFNFVSGKM